MKTQKNKPDRDEEIKVSFWGLKVEAKNPKTTSLTILFLVLSFIIILFLLSEFFK